MFITILFTRSLAQTEGLQGTTRISLEYEGELRFSVVTDVTTALGVFVNGMLEHI